MIGIERIRSFGSATLVAILLACASCGGGSSASPDGGGAAGAGGTGGGGTGGTVVAGTPVALCNKLVSTICMRLKTCNVLSDPTKFVEANCESSETVEFGCARATSTGFGDCVTDVSNVTCGGLFSTTAGLVLPPSCDDPVNTIPLSAAQIKCSDLAAADCARAAMCLGITPTTAQLQQCQADDYAQNGCGLATDVGATYTQCLQDLSTAPCPSDGGVDSTDGGGSTLVSCETAITFVQ